MSLPMHCVKCTLVSQLILKIAVLTTVASAYEFESGLMKALVIPSDIAAVIGEQIFFKVIEPVDQQTHCYYRINNGEEIDIKKPHKQT